MKIRVATKPDECPVCGSKKIATILRGMPAYSEKLLKDIDEDKVILGGCIVSGDDPRYVCVDCKTDFYRTLDWLN